MEIVNRKEISRFINTIILFTLLSIVVPIGFYLYKFNSHELSDSKTDWGTFGDFIGGVVGTILNLIAALFSLVSVYITLRIATRIHESEQKFNKENIEREKERFEKEIELTYKQNRPYLYLDLLRHPDIVKMDISNYGIGPLVIKKMEIIYDGKDRYDNMQDLCKYMLETRDIGNCLIYYNSAKQHILAPNNSKNILKIVPEKTLDKVFEDSNKKLRDYLKLCKINFTYQDMFENENSQEFTLGFLDGD